MIKKLRTKFIVLATVAVLILLGIVVAGMNIVNYRSVMEEAEETLDILASNRGTFPVFAREGGENRQFERPEGFAPKEVMDPDDIDDDADDDDIYDDLDDDEHYGFPKGMNPEAPYESRFFSVLYNSNGERVLTDTQHITSVTEAEAAEYADEAIARGSEEGRLGDFIYRISEDGDGRRVTFLDWGRKIDAYRSFLMISLIAAAAGFVLFFFVIFFYSKRIIRPVAESYEKQKRFITDAGHEIRTPLAIIKADADVLEMENEGSEWVEDIQKQADRLSVLTDDLVSLARMEEGRDASEKAEFALSEAVAEEAGAYESLAKALDKTLRTDIKEGISFNGNEKSIRRLVDILMDNAIKYSAPNGEISIRLDRTGKNIKLEVFNFTENEISKENLELIFDRFYRMDTSRSSETGGHGIGLSMAKAIAESHGGKITAATEDGRSLKIEVILPAA